MKLFPIAFSAGAAALVAGCSALPGTFIDPVVQLNEVVVRGLGPNGGTMDLVLDVYNPNGFNLRGTQLQLGFDVEGTHVGDVTYSDEFQIQRNDTATVVLPLRFTWSGVSAAVRTALSTGEIPYTMRGQATVRTPFGNRVVPFTRGGRVPLAQSRAASTTPSSSGR